MTAMLGPSCRRPTSKSMGSWPRAPMRFVKCEAQTVPVGRDAELLELGQDDASVLLFPLPDATHEFVAPKSFLCQPLFLDLTLDDCLCGDAGVIHARQPQSLEPLPAIVPDRDVLECHIESVSDVQVPSDIGWRHHDDEWCSVGVGLRMKSRLAE